MSRLWLLLTLPACHVENSLKDGDDEPGYTDSGDTADTDTADTSPDSDTADTSPDSADTSDSTDSTDTATPCPPLDLAPAGTVPVNPACDAASVPAVSSPWSARIAWTFDAPAADATARNSYTAPVVGNLDDDNGDGVVDEDDVPDVILNVTGSTTWIVAIDGATGAEKWAWSGASYWGSMAVADVDGDGVPEVLAYDASSLPVALTASGTLLWRATTAAHAAVPLLSVADLDGDGAPEVIADDSVLDGATGATRFSLHVSRDAQHRMTAVADADLDGDQELFIAGDAYDSDGALLWASSAAGQYGFWPLVVQADADPEAEIGFVGNTWELFDTDGTPLASAPFGTPAQPGPPCAGDFDGDGETEVAWSSAGVLAVYEVDGSVVWAASVDDTEGYAGCSGFDLDGDGALEVLFAGESSFLVFEGRSGTQHLLDGDHRSVTLFEYPTVADLDHDGAAEILAVSNGATAGSLVVLEHAGAGWPPAGPTWATHDFAVTTVRPDGSVPATPEPYWTTHGVYRARGATDAIARPDLTVTVTDTCVSDCSEGPASLSVQVANEGAADVPAGATLSVYDGTTLLTSLPLPEVAAGAALAGVEIELPGAPPAAWTVTVDTHATGAPGECDEENDTVVVASGCG